MCLKKGWVPLENVRPLTTIFISEISIKAKLILHDTNFQIINWHKGRSHAPLQNHMQLKTCDYGKKAVKLGLFCSHFIIKYTFYYVLSFSFSTYFCFFSPWAAVKPKFPLWKINKRIILSLTSYIQRTERPGGVVFPTNSWLLIHPRQLNKSTAYPDCASDFYLFSLVFCPLTVTNSLHRKRNTVFCFQHLQWLKYQLKSFCILAQRIPTSH